MKDYYKRTVYGVGYLGIHSDGSKPKTSQGKSKQTREYLVWYSMIKRCYSGKYKSYETVTVCERWHSFALFLEDLPKIQNYEYWKENPQQGIALDKNKFYAERGLVTDSKVYSLETCRFISNLDNVSEMMDRVGKPIRKIKAIHIETGEEQTFNSQSECARELKLKQGAISECLSGKRLKCKGYKFELVE